MRIAGARSEPPRGRSGAGAGRQAREAGWAAKSRRAGHEHGAGDDQRGGGRPRDADEQDERRPDDPRQLDGGRLGGVGRAQGFAVADDRGKDGAQARVDRWRAQSQDDGQRHEQRDGRAGRQRGGPREGCARDQRARDEDHRLPAAIDQPAEQRPADPERHGEGARDDAGRRERAGQVAYVDEQRDAEHGHWQARDDRDGREAQGAGE